MKKLTSLMLTAAMLTATTSQFAFADDLTTAQTAMSKITAGTVILAADTTLNGKNSATQYEKNKAVNDYVKSFLMGDLSGVTSEVSYDDGDYIITLKDADSNTASKTISDEDFDFVYTVKAFNDDFNYVNEQENLDGDESNDVEISAFANLLDGKFSLVATASQFDIKNAAIGISPDAVLLDGNSVSLKTWQGVSDIYIQPAQTVYYENDIGENYIFETNFKVQDRITDEHIEEYYPSENRINNIGVDFWSAMMTVANKKYEMSFTPENDGLYYKTVDADGTTAKWEKHEMNADNNMHSYKVIAEGSKAKLYIDGVYIVEWSMPATTDRNIKFSANIGAVKNSPEQDILETELDFWRIYNVYENQVFIEDFKSFDNVYTMTKNNGEMYYELLNNINPAEPGKHLNSKYVLDGMFNVKSNNAQGDKKYIYYKVPKNSKITDVRIHALRTVPMTVSLQRYGYGGDKLDLINNAVAVKNPSNTGNAVSIATVYANTGTGKIIKVSDEIKAILGSENQINYDVVEISYASWSTLNYNHYNGISGIEIEYEYFYDDLDDDNTEVAFADNMTNIVSITGKTDPLTIYGYTNTWQFDGIEMKNESTTTTWNVGKYSRFSTKGGKNAGGVEFTPLTSDYGFADVKTNSFTDVGSSYIYSGEIFLDKAYLKGGDFENSYQNGSVDLLTNIYNNGYLLSFAPHWDGNAQKFAYKDSTNNYQLIDMPDSVTITDKAFNDYKAVVNNDTASVYINDQLVNTWQLPAYDTEKTSPMVEFFTVGTKNTLAAKAAVRNVAILKPQEKVVELIDGISGIGNASYIGQDTSSIMVTFRENKLGKEFNAYCAQYGTDGRLTSVQIVNVPETGTNELFIVPSDATGYKFYFWDSDLSPVYDVLHK